jgi:hypothetical protein
MCQTIILMTPPPRTCPLHAVLEEGVLILLGSFSLPPSSPLPPFSHDHDLYTLCPKIYVIKIINVINTYTTIGLCHSPGLKFVTRTCATKPMSLIISQAKVCVTWGWVYYVIGTDVIKAHDVIQPMSIKFVVSLRLMSSLGLSLTYKCHWGLCEFGLFH